MSPNRHFSILLTVGDKLTLPALQNKELVFVDCLLLQLDGTMARCVGLRLTEATSVRLLFEGGSHFFEHALHVANI